jgi:ATP-dependent helicase HepA
MWIVGQRVVSEFEPELGLGLVIKVVGVRVIEVLFSKAEVSRQYAARGAPLRRLILNAGQKILSKDGSGITVVQVKEVGGLFLYAGDGKEVWEYEISEVVDDRNTLNQFLLGQWSRHVAFDLRRASWKGRTLGVDPELRGLVGARLALIPHQLYIAAETTKREFPRCLLADEVGLGKTIEAGLIFSAMRALGRADHVLVLVPESLKHQWLAEMYRCFNEMFSVVDKDYLEQELLSQNASAFSMNQRLICPIELLVEDSERLEEALAENWDLLIVDEAHHLRWSEEEPTPEWEVTRQLSKKSRGLLLLTATPEFAGLHTKFGLLQLVDPARFSDFETFQKNHHGMKKTAALAKAIFSGNRSPEILTQIKKSAKSDEELLARIREYENGAEPEVLLKSLIDRHGTGRVFIRNRRARLKGFPGRDFKPVPLESPKTWQEHLHSLKISELDDRALLRLAAGRQTSLRAQANKDAFQKRCEWLLDLLKSLNGDKLLLICARIETVLLLEAWLKNNSAIRTGIFHEELEIVERDRQAAWFAQNDGAQILLCSEIGGEGRNFQFSHHLVLFDLPTHPDLLEQRIGRLDRIGQKTRIEIHAPFFENTPEEVMLFWFAEGLSSFSQAWNGGAAGWDESADELIETIKAFLPKSPNFKKRREKLKSLIKNTSHNLAAILEKQQDSLDVLVDLNSFDENKGAELASQVSRVDEDPALSHYMHSVFDYFGVESEDMDHSRSGTLKITAHSLSFVDNFPGLGAHGERLVTFNRNLALSREEVAFLTWDHPMVQGALSLVLEGDQGKATAAIWSAAPEGADFYLETLFVLQVTAPAYLEVERFLPVLSWDILIDSHGNKTQLAPPRAEDLKPLPQKLVLEGFKDLNKTLLHLLGEIQTFVEKEAAQAVLKAKSKMEDDIRERLGRLNHLARINPLISPDELMAAKQKASSSLAALETCTPRLDAIRMLVPERRRS